MARKSRFDLAFEELRTEFTAATKRRFFRDIQGQLEEHEEVRDILRANRSQPRYVAVSFDRRLNDAGFSYHYFDLVLVALDAIAGGSGIYKPVNQLRVLRWNGTRQQLLKVLRYLASYNPQIDFRRLLILPYPAAVVGRRIDRKVHRK